MTRLYSWLTERFARAWVAFWLTVAALLGASWLVLPGGGARCLGGIGFCAVVAGAGWYWFGRPDFPSPPGES